MPAGAPLMFELAVQLQSPCVGSESSTLTLGKARELSEP